MIPSALSVIVAIAVVVLIVVIAYIFAVKLFDWV